MIEVLLAFFAAIPIPIGSLTILNVLFFLALIIRGFKIPSSGALATGLLFAGWVLLGNILAGVTFSWMPTDSRVLIQLAFSVQYCVLALRINLDSHRLFRWLARFAFLFAAGIVVAFFTTGTFRGWAPFSNRLWGSEIFPGWPNGISVPLGFVLWGILQKGWGFKRKMPAVITISAALFLTTSRGAVLAGGLIWLWHLYTRQSQIAMPKILRFLSLLLLVSAGAVLILTQSSEELLTALTRSHDRVSITDTSGQLIELSPVYGYGGRTLEQIQGNLPVTLGSFMASQTHNMILEITIRHGVVGLVLLSIFFVFMFKNVRGRDQWFILIVLCVLALTQDFIRNFIFLFVIYLLAYYCDNNRSVR